MTGPLMLAAGTHVLRGGRTIIGGDPPRALRLSAAGARAVGELISGTGPATPARAALAARLVSTGMAHPRPALIAPAGSVTLVVPVHDRAAELDRCLRAASAASGDAPMLVVDDGSADPAAIADVCARHGATVARRDVCGGPAAARNCGLARVNTELVAFLDSDCVPRPGWLDPLCGALRSPQVAAAAPRIRPLRAAKSGAVARFAADRSPLDLGPHPARVRPGGRVAYVPTAALLVRRAALGSGFDPTLRYGEDVDLIWRLHDEGWTVRYEPTAVVDHAEPAGFAQLARRRFRYGSAAGPLARRHPQRLAPVRLHPRPAAILALLVARRPAVAAAAASAHVALTVRALRRAETPPAVAARLALNGLADSAVAIGRAATMLAPGLMAAGLLARCTRSAAVALTLAEPLRSWMRARPELDPIRWCALAIADDVAYGAGVWTGALRVPTIRPLTPAVSWATACPGGAGDRPIRARPPGGAARGARRALPSRPD